MMDSDQLNLVFAALADPIRRAIVVRLAAGEATVAQLAKPFTISQPAISKHLKVLEKSGLILIGREAQQRPRRLEVKAMKECMDWMQTYCRIWEGNYARLETLLGAMKVAQKPLVVRKRKGG
jgi:DNA-binding transcriptional ArsR family regulator